MAKKQEYALKMNGTDKTMTVKGEIYGNFGLDKRDTGYFVITHIPSGCLVCSSKKKKDLVTLLEDEEFWEEYWSKTRPDDEYIKKLAVVVAKYYSQC